MDSINTNQYRNPKRTVNVGYVRKKWPELSAQYNDNQIQKIIDTMYQLAEIAYYSHQNNKVKKENE